MIEVDDLEAGRVNNNVWTWLNQNRLESHVVSCRKCQLQGSCDDDWGTVKRVEVIDPQSAWCMNGMRVRG